MGFSVSGASAIVFVAIFVGFGIFYSAAFNASERVTDAYEESGDHMLEQKNTAVNVSKATYDSGSATVNVTVANTGSTTLAVNDTDILLDNEYQTAFTVREVDGDTNTDVWMPGETLHVEISASTKPTSVKVVTGPGVADREVI